MRIQNVRNMLGSIGKEYEEYDDPGDIVYKHNPINSDYAIRTLVSGIVFEFKNGILVDIWCME